MDWQYLFLSFEGRIGRKSFWLGVVAFIVVSIIGSVLDSLLGTRSNGVGIIGVIIAIVCIYPAFALYAKRWHDRNKSGWWSLIAIIPIIGGVWILIELGFLKGTEGSNRFGADPVGAALPA